MNLFSTFSLALGLSADAFAVAAAKGTTLPQKPRVIDAVRIGALFGAVEAMTPILGWGLGKLTSHYVEAVDHWIAFVILAGLGVHMIAESLRRDCAVQEPRAPGLGGLILAAISSSIDALGVGVTLAFIDANLLLTSAAIGLTTFAMATTGVLVGHKAGCAIGKVAEVFGGLVLIVIGLVILAEHMGAF
jgi:putative Mn2+ efflux pump MntP